MLSASLHREDIKATLRKRHGTVQAFAEARGLKPQAIADWLRGRVSSRVAEAVEAELQEAKHEEEVEKSIKLDDSDVVSPAHRQNAGAR